MEEKKVKIGVFGCSRGSAVAACLKLAGAEIVAGCDSNPKALERLKPHLAEDGVLYDNFDKFIEHEMDGCVLTNYFSEHVPFAIRLLERGISVFSECASNSTMAEGVALVRAVEAAQGKAIYMLNENYPFSAACQELKRVYQKGDLGRAVYGYGEYVHPMSLSENKYFAPFEGHWRNHIPATYYNTHSLGPLMYATETMPLTVTAQAVSRPETAEGTESKKDPFALMMCKMSDGSLFTFTGWAGIGGHGSSYRINCTKGAAETVRYDGSRLRVVFNNWETPEGMPRDTRYAPSFPYDADKAAKCGHSGGDYFTALEFVHAIEGKSKPFFDVYRSTAMASCAILGWRSCLDGKTYAIPDFSREEDRQLYENDHFSPFVAEDDSNFVPCSLLAASDVAN